MVPFFGERREWLALPLLLCVAACGDKAPEPAPVPAPPPATSAAPPVKPAQPATSGPTASNPGKELVARIRKALADDDTLSRRAIDVTVKDGVARIWGTVASKAEIARAGELVKAIPGVASVENRLVVVQGS